MGLLSRELRNDACMGREDNRKIGLDQKALKPAGALSQQTPEGEITKGALKLPCKISGAPLQ